MKIKNKLIYLILFTASSHIPFKLNLKSTLAVESITNITDAYSNKVIANFIINNMDNRYNLYSGNISVLHMLYNFLSKIKDNEYKIIEQICLNYNKVLDIKNKRNMYYFLKYIFYELYANIKKFINNNKYTSNDEYENYRTFLKDNYNFISKNLVDIKIVLNLTKFLIESYFNSSQLQKLNKINTIQYKNEESIQFKLSMMYDSDNIPNLEELSELEKIYCDINTINKHLLFYKNLKNFIVPINIEYFTRMHNDQIKNKNNITNTIDLNIKKNLNEDNFKLIEKFDQTNNTIFNQLDSYIENLKNLFNKNSNINWNYESMKLNNFSSDFQNNCQNLFDNYKFKLSDVEICSTNLNSFASNIEEFTTYKDNINSLEFLEQRKITYNMQFLITHMIDYVYNFLNSIIPIVKNLKLTQLNQTLFQIHIDIYITNVLSQLQYFFSNKFFTIFKLNRILIFCVQLLQDIKAVFGLISNMANDQEKSEIKTKIEEMNIFFNEDYINQLISSLIKFHIQPILSISNISANDFDILTSVYDKNTVNNKIMQDNISNMVKTTKNILLDSNSTINKLVNNCWQDNDGFISEQNMKNVVTRYAALYSEFLGVLDSIILPYMQNYQKFNLVSLKRSLSFNLINDAINETSDNIFYLAQHGISQDVYKSFINSNIDKPKDEENTNLNLNNVTFQDMALNKDDEPKFNSNKNILNDVFNKLKPKYEAALNQQNDVNYAKLTLIEILKKLVELN